MRACWAVQGEEAPGRVFFAVWALVFSQSGILPAYRFVWSYDPRSVRGYSVTPLSHSLFFACLPVWLYDTQSVQGYSVHPPFLCAKKVTNAFPSLLDFCLSCYAASLLRSPGPWHPTVFRTAICDCLLINGCSSVLFGLACMIPGQYEVIHHTLSLCSISPSLTQRWTPLSSAPSRTP